MSTLISSLTPDQILKLRNLIADYSAQDLLRGKETEVKMSQTSRLDGAQGANEKRTELYLTYGDGASEFVRQRFAKGAGGVAGSASRQAGVAGSLR